MEGACKYDIHRKAGAVIEILVLENVDSILNTLIHWAPCERKKIMVV